jgi:hypothetical protein
MFEDSRTVAIKVRIERYSVANIPEQGGKGLLAVLKWCPTEILAVKFDEIESAQDGCVIVMAMAYQIEDRETVLIDDNRLAINHT